MKILILTTILIIGSTTGFPVDDNDGDEFNPANLKPAAENDADLPAFIAEEEHESQDDEGASDNVGYGEEIVPILRPESGQENRQGDTEESHRQHESEEIHLSDETVEFNFNEVDDDDRKKRSEPEPEPQPGTTSDDDTIVINACEPLRMACQNQENPRSSECRSFREKCQADEADGTFIDPFDTWPSAGTEKK